MKFDRRQIEAWAIETSAPGKAILIGEHAAVYGRPALVAAVDGRLRCRLSAEPGTDRDATLHLELPDIDIDEALPWRDIDAYASDRRARWQEFERQPAAEGFAGVLGHDPAHVVKVAVGEALAGCRQRLADPALLQPPTARLRVTSTLPVGSGFGSSAAVSVAVLAAVCRLFEVELSVAELHALSVEVERRQHGSPSGVDSAAVIHGGVVWAQRSAAGMSIEPLAVDGSPVLKNFRLLHTGEAAESTGDVVAAVGERRRRDRQLFERQLDAMADATADLRREVESEVPSSAAVIDSVRRFQSLLEALGVVPEPVADLVRDIERRGGAAKISGAGSLRGPGAGALLVYHPEAGWSGAQRYPRLDLALGAEGLRLDA